MGSKYISPALRQEVHERAGNCCEYCYAQLGFSPDPFNAEHILPVSKGGKTVSDNLSLACFGCNNAKGTATTAVDPLTGQMVALYHPRQQQWSDHFRWNSTCTNIIGISPHGRATVACLKLNRSGLTNLRRILYEANAHPPVNQA